MGLCDHRVLMCAVAFFYIADVAAGSAEAGELPDVFEKIVRGIARSAGLYCTLRVLTRRSAKSSRETVDPGAPGP